MQEELIVESFMSDTVGFNSDSVIILHPVNGGSELEEPMKTVCGEGALAEELNVEDELTFYGHQELRGKMRMEL